VRKKKGRRSRDGKRVIREGKVRTVSSLKEIEVWRERETKGGIGRGKAGALKKKEGGASRFAGGKKKRGKEEETSQGEKGSFSLR